MGCGASSGGHDGPWQGVPLGRDVTYSPWHPPVRHQPHQWGNSEEEQQLLQPPHARAPGETETPCLAGCRHSQNRTKLCSCSACETRGLMFLEEPFPQTCVRQLRSDSAGWHGMGTGDGNFTPRSQRDRAEDKGHVGPAQTWASGFWGRWGRDLPVGYEAAPGVNGNGAWRNMAWGTKNISLNYWEGNNQLKTGKGFSQGSKEHLTLLQPSRRDR